MIDFSAYTTECLENGSTDLDIVRNYLSTPLNRCGLRLSLLSADLVSELGSAVAISLLAKHVVDVTRAYAEEDYKDSAVDSVIGIMIELNEIAAGRSSEEDYQ